MSSVTALDLQGPWWMAKRYATSLIQYFLKPTEIVKDWTGMFNVQVEVHLFVRKESMNIQQFYWLFLFDSRPWTLKCQPCDTTPATLPIFIWSFISFSFLLLFLHLLPFFNLHLNNTSIQPMSGLLMYACIRMKLWHSVQTYKRCWDEILLHKHAKVTSKKCSGAHFHTMRNNIAEMSTATLAKCFH